MGGLRNLAWLFPVEAILEPFGLHDTDSYMAADQHAVEEIRRGWVRLPMLSMFVDVLCFLSSVAPFFLSFCGCPTKKCLPGH